MRSIHACTQRISHYFFSFAIPVCLSLSLFLFFFFFIIRLLLEKRQWLRNLKIFVSAFHHDCGPHGHGLRGLAFLEIFELFRSHVDSCCTIYQSKLNSKNEEMSYNSDCVSRDRVHRYPTLVARKLVSCFETPGVKIHRDINVVM